MTASASQPDTRSASTSASQTIDAGQVDVALDHDEGPLHESNISLFP